MSRRLGIAGLLIALTAALYAPVLALPFVGWDDGFYVTRNPQVASGLSLEGVAWAFRGTPGAWHPLTWLSHMLDGELFGLDARGHHATNLALHALNVAALFALLVALSGRAAPSAGAALLFALHPLHVESVAWVSDRKDLLCTAMALLASAAYVAYARRGGVGRYALCAALLTLALLAKAMAVTLPFVFLLLDYWPLARRPSRRLLFEKIPLLALCVAAAAITWITQDDAGAMLSGEPLTLAERLANALLSYATYLRQMLWPSGLAYFYPHPYLAESGGLPPSGLRLALSAAALLAVSVGVAWGRRQRWATVGWCWFLGTLVPVIGWVQVGIQGHADRYMYLPSIGLCVIAAWGVAEVHAALGRRANARALRAGLLAAVGCALVALGVTTRAQITHWNGSFALFERAIEAVPRNPTVRYNLANRLRERGELEAAIGHYRRALEALPEDPRLLVNLANALRERDPSDDDAIALYRRALEFAPGDAAAHTNLASAYRERGRIEEALAHYRAALDAGPHPTALYNLANLLRSEGRLAEAIARYREALALAPRDPRIHNNLGHALLETGELADRQSALGHFSQAAVLRPRHAPTYHNLGLALQRAGLFEDAIEAQRRALAIRPEYADAHRELAVALRSLGRDDEARDHERRAREIESREAPR